MYRSWAAGVVVLLGAFAGAPVHGERAAAATHRIIVVAEGFRSEKGPARVALFAGPDGFPGDSERAVRRAVASIRDGRAVAEFDGLAPGTYAVAVHHDENDNGKVDSNLFGAPREAVGFSRGASSAFGPPKFRDASFELAARAAEVRITVRYR